MQLSSQPLVSVVTPVYNGGQYLTECIESVLSQTYESWEYHIVDNCSTDDSLKIAKEYERKDQRIRVHDNKDFLPMVQNFNHSLLKISSESKYCKVIHADDMLFPNCIFEMVSFAEDHPSVGIVSSYVMSDVRIMCDGLPYPTSFFRGREIARMSLLNQSPGGGPLYVFGSPTSLLMRSDLIRNRMPFYHDKYSQVTDQEACYYVLQKADFGFIYKILTFSRVHSQSSTSSLKPLNRLILEELMLLLDYGPVYLTRNEFERRLEKRLAGYYHFLARSFFEGKGKEFWEYHRAGFGKVDQFRWEEVTKIIRKELPRKVMRGLLHPSKAFLEARLYLRQRSMIQTR